MHDMRQSGKLSDLEERVLSTLWKLKGVGRNTISEQTLTQNLTAQVPGQDWTQDIKNLQELGFLTSEARDGHISFSLTPLGLSFLRQAEEDRLQELK
jgi:hypothetical protein